MSDPVTDRQVAMLGLAVATSGVAAYAIRSAVAGRRREARAEQAHPTRLLPLWFLEGFYWALQLPVRACVRARVPPDAITALSALLAVAAAWPAAQGRFGAAAVLFVAGAMLDALDGQVARGLGRASAAGEMLDSVVDRYADLAVLLGLAWYWRDSPARFVLVGVALAGVSLVSYVRARAQGLGVELPATALRRHERVVLLAVALALSPIGPRAVAWAGVRVTDPWLLLAVAVLAVAGNVIALRMMFRARRILAGRAAVPVPPEVP